VGIQWYSGLSLSRLLSISNKKLGPLDICVLCKLILSLYLELLHLYIYLSSLYRTKKFLVSCNHFSLYLELSPPKSAFTQEIEQKIFDTWEFEYKQNLRNPKIAIKIFWIKKDAISFCFLFSDEGVQMKTLILNFERLDEKERLNSKTKSYYRLLINMFNLCVIF